MNLFLKPAFVILRVVLLLQLLQLLFCWLTHRCGTWHVAPRIVQRSVRSLTSLYECLVDVVFGEALETHDLTEVIDETDDGAFPRLLVDVRTVNGVVNATDFKTDFFPVVEDDGNLV